MVWDKQSEFIRTVLKEQAPIFCGIHNVEEESKLKFPCASSFRKKKVRISFSFYVIKKTNKYERVHKKNGDIF